MGWFSILFSNKMSSGTISDIPPRARRLLAQGFTPYFRRSKNLITLKKGSKERSFRIAYTPERMAQMQHYRPGGESEKQQEYEDGPPNEIPSKPGDAQEKQEELKRLEPKSSEEIELGPDYRVDDIPVIKVPMKLRWLSQSVLTLYSFARAGGFNGSVEDFVEHEVLENLNNQNVALAMVHTPMLATLTDEQAKYIRFFRPTLAHSLDTNEDRDTPPEGSEEETQSLKPDKGDSS